MNFLYWNINKNNIIEIINNVCIENEVDVLIHSECEISKKDILLNLNEGNDQKYYLQYSAIDDPIIFAKYSKNLIIAVSEYPGLSIRNFFNPLNFEFIIVVVHLPSKSNLQDKEQALLSTRFIKYIEDIETEFDHKRTIIIGDLNMSPFEDGVVGAEGFHTIMDREYVKRRKSRFVAHKEKHFFYNPMWKHFDFNNSGVYGTYHYSSGQINHYWYIFDQILIRPDLIDNISDKNIKIITGVKGKTLLKKDGTPNGKDISDHLPIFFKFIL